MTSMYRLLRYTCVNCPILRWLCRRIIPASRIFYLSLYLLRLTGKHLSKPLEPHHTRKRAILRWDRFFTNRRDT